MTVSTFEIASAADDGSGYKTGGSYPPGSAYNVEDGATCWAWKGATNNEVDVSFVRWDTSAIADGDDVSDVKVRIFISAKNDADGRNLVCDWYDFGGEPSVDADWTASVGTDAFSVAIASLTAGDWNEITLSNPTNVNKTGYTGLRFGISGGAATGANDVAIVGYENDPAFAPELVVTHAAAGGGGEEGAKRMLLLGVG